MGCVFWSAVLIFLFFACGFQGVLWLIGGHLLRGTLLIVMGCSWTGFGLVALWDIFTGEH
jgi:hypothetical protein